MDVDEQKRLAALAASAEVRSGMAVGLGTGSTAYHVVEELGRRVREEELSVRAVATSDATATHARAVGIELLDMGSVATLDLAIDGVDEIDPAFRAIKGGGGAMLREKVVAQAAARMIAIADASKLVERLGAARPLPIEILPFASRSVLARVAGLGGEAVIRPTTSDQRNLLADCVFGPIDDPDGLAAALAAIPGLLGHGLFLTEIDALYIGSEDPARRRERNASVTID